MTQEKKKKLRKKKKKERTSGSVVLKKGQALCRRKGRKRAKKACQRKGREKETGKRLKKKNGKANYTTNIHREKNKKEKEQRSVRETAMWHKQLQMEDSAGDVGISYLQ